MRKRKRLTRQEKKQLYKTPAGYKAVKRKKNAEQLNKELNHVNDKTAEKTVK